MLHSSMRSISLLAITLALALFGIHPVQAQEPLGLEKVASPAGTEQAAKSSPPEGAVPPLVTSAPQPVTNGRGSIVRVNVTNQPWDFFRPWGKRAPFSRRAIGSVLPGGVVLVTAELVANSTYLEFELPEGGLKTPARVVIADYEANLALLAPEDKADKFLEAYTPLDFTKSKAGDIISVLQLESTGIVLGTSGPVTTVEVARYPQEEYAFLIYRATVSLQSKDSSFCLPVVRDGKLTGLLMRYDNAANQCDVIPEPVISHFLRDYENAPYEGFPRTGMVFSNLRDPQLRKYLGMDSRTGGVYVTDVLRNGPAEKAGIKSGDVLLRVDDNAVDQDGNVIDPDYGKLGLSHLTSTRHMAGDKITLEVFRDRQVLKLEATLRRRLPEEQIIEPYVLDKAPRYYFLGGLILQELSRQYLKEFGGDWARRAPRELVYFDRFQADLYPEGPKRLVLLTRVLANELTVGYEDVSQVIVTKVNDVSLDSLADIERALAASKNGVHKIEFDSEPKCIYLDAEAVKAAEPELMRQYRLPSIKRLD